MASSQDYVQSKAHARYLGKQANSTTGKSNPLDARGQTHRAGRDQAGNIVSAGDGEADAPPGPNDAAKILMRSAQSGIDYEDLPERSPTANAARKDSEHAKMKGKKPPKTDQVVRPAMSPPGAKHLQRQAAKRYRNQLHQRNLSNSKEYLSKSINERFGSALDEALGL